MSIIIPYSQKDPRWKDEKIGKTNLTFEKAACYLVSLSMLTNKSPKQLNALLTAMGGYTPEGLIISDKAAKILNLKYTKIPANLNQPPVIPCILETDFYKNKGIPQHFVLWLGCGNWIIDSLTGVLNDFNQYTRISYRVFT